ncbi:MAG: hypothetical protein ACP5IX_03035 [Patescibacteria group bacterium]
MEQIINQDLIQEIFVKEYDKIITQAIAALSVLEKRMGTNQAIAFLITEPLIRWPTVVKRLLKVSQNQI